MLRGPPIHACCWSGKPGSTPWEREVVANNLHGQRKVKDKDTWVCQAKPQASPRPVERKLELQGPWGRCNDGTKRAKEKVARNKCAEEHWRADTQALCCVPPAASSPGAPNVLEEFFLKGRETEKYLPSAGSLPNCPHQPGLNQLKTGCWNSTQISYLASKVLNSRYVSRTLKIRSWARTSTQHSDMGCR